jgi:uncharacterized RDD family membrane protein YckC
MSQESGAIFQARSISEIAEQYGVSIIVRRWLGCWVDLVGCASCLLIPDWLLGNELYQKTIFIWLALAFSYFIVGEWRWGRTPGKLLTGTVVVTEKGTHPSLGQVLIRTIFRLLEVNPFLMGGIPAGIVAALSKKKQRIGDMVAGTYVICARDLPKTN